jgi:hypothetical protein
MALMRMKRKPSSARTLIAEPNSQNCRFGILIPSHALRHGRDAGRTRGAPMNQSRQSWSPGSLFVEALASLQFCGLRGCRGEGAGTVETLRRRACCQGRPASHTTIWSQQEPPTSLTSVRVLHHPSDADSYSLTLVNDEWILPPTNGQPRPSRRQHGFPLVSSPEATRPTTELDLASGEQVSLRVQLLTVSTQSLPPMRLGDPGGIPRAGG